MLSVGVEIKLTMTSVPIRIHLVRGVLTSAPSQCVVFHLRIILHDMEELETDADSESDSWSRYL